MNNVRRTAIVTGAGSGIGAAITSSLGAQCEVETPILDARPVPVSAQLRARILQPEDVAEAVLLACTLPSRARIPEVTIVLTTQSFF